MTRRRMKARDRRALVLGLIVVAPVAAYRQAAAPWLDHMSELRTSFDTERALLARERAAIRQAAEAPARMEALRAGLESAEPLLFPGASDVEVSGAMSRYVADWGAEERVLIQEVQAGRTEALSGALASSSLSVRALGDLEGLARFLHGLENGDRLVRVEELTLRAAGVNDGDVERGQLMSLGVMVTGYWLRSPEDEGTDAGNEAGAP
jgi:hypothetical protein